MNLSKKSASTSSFLKPLKGILRKFHLTMFFVFVIAFLGGAVMLLNNMLSEVAQSDDYVSGISAGAIDRATLERIKTLHTSDEAYTQPALPAGRVNPFNE